MGREIDHKSVVLDIVNGLTKINKSVIVWREDDIRISMTDGDRLIAYEMHVPHSYFDIDESIAFYNFPEFYQFYSSIKDAMLDVREETILISGEDSKINYFLSPVEKVNIGSDDKPFSPKSISFDDHEFEFMLSKKNLAELKKTASMLGVSNIKFISNISDKYIVIKTYNDDQDISAEKNLPMINVSKLDKDFSLDIIADHIERLPTAFDYMVYIKGGRLKFSAKTNDENITLNIYTARRKA